MMIKRIVLITWLVLTVGMLARAEGIDDLVARADQAFAGADYKTALDLYRQIEPRLDDAARKAAMRERMRFAERQLSLIQKQGVDPTTRPAPTTGPAQAERKPFVRTSDGKTLELSLHELGNFDFAEDNDASIPKDVRDLSGATVKIPGQMLPLDQAGRVTRFILVNDLLSCCFGNAPKLQHVAYVSLPKDKWIEATGERITVEGKLKVNVRREDGYVLSIFEIEPTSIKYAAQ